MDLSHIHIMITSMLAIIAYLFKREITALDKNIDGVKLKMTKLEDNVNDHIQTDLQSHGAITENLKNIHNQLERLENYLIRLIDVKLKNENK